MNTMNSFAEPGWLHQTGAKARSLIEYPRFRRRYVGSVAPTPAETPVAHAQEELNRRMLEYPRNHFYRLVDGRLEPGFRLYERLRIVQKAYPQPLRSFLDIGCCRGFYALDAAVRLGCPRAVGIDVHEPFIVTAGDAAAYLRVPNVAFHYAALEEVSRDPEKFGGPFQVVMLIGTYHYLFWGSGFCPTAYHSHEEILRRLASICTDRLLISARLTVQRLPRSIRSKAKEGPDAAAYTPETFLQNAEKFFQVRHAGYLGVYPLFVMTKST